MLNHRSHLADVRLKVFSTMTTTPIARNTTCASMEQDHCKPVPTAFCIKNMVPSMSSVLTNGTFHVQWERQPQDRSRHPDVPGSSVSSPKKMPLTVRPTTRSVRGASLNEEHAIPRDWSMTNACTAVTGLIRRDAKERMFWESAVPRKTSTTRSIPSRDTTTATRRSSPASPISPV